MSDNNVLLFALLLVVYLKSFAQIEGKKEYIKFEQLTWAYYKGAPNQSFFAVTTSGIQLDGQRLNSKTGLWDLIKVYAYIIPDKCYVQNGATELQKGYYFTHEALHYKMTITAAKRLRKLINETKIHNQSEYNALYDKFFREWAIYRDSYDLETLHGDDYKKQGEWAEKINREYEKYKYVKLDSNN